MNITKFVRLLSVTEKIFLIPARKAANRKQLLSLLMF